MGAGIAETVAENLPSSLPAERRLDIAVLGGGIGAFIAGGDVNAAGVAGTIAVENNWEKHKDEHIKTLKEVQQEQSSVLLSSRWEQDQSQLRPFHNPLDVNPGGPLSLKSGGVRSVSAKVTPKPSATTPRGNKPAANPQTSQAPSANSWIVNTAQYPSNNYKLRYSLASKQQMREPGTIIAGRGAKKTFDDAPRIVSPYGGRLEDWVKKSSSIYRPTDGSPFQTHWVENLKTAKKVEFKIKIIEE